MAKSWVITSIEWAEKTWSPLRVRVREDAAIIALDKGYTSLIQIGEKMAGRVGHHCEHVSDGCKLCYSGTWQRRCFPVNGTGLPFDRRSRDLVEAFLDQKELLAPSRWRKPQKVFVENQSDLFGEWFYKKNDAVWLDMVFALMTFCPQHTFQVLTKRTSNAVDYLLEDVFRCRTHGINRQRQTFYREGIYNQQHPHISMPIANAHIGFSAENQATFDARWADMRQLAAAGWMVWCSYEPALGIIDMSAAMDDTSARLSWVVVGGESGPGARPFDPAWALATLMQCGKAGIPAFVKQFGSRPKHPHGCSEPRMCRLYPDEHGEDGMLRMYLKSRKGGDMSEWPEDLRVRQFPQERVTPA